MDILNDIMMQIMHDHHAVLMIKKKRSSFTSVSSLFMQIYFDSDLYPGTYDFL